MLLGSAVDIVLSSVEERYELGDMIGVGHFSQVHCARPAGSLGEHSIALKGIEQSVLNDDEEALAMLVGECRALRLASECSALQSRVVRLREVLGTPTRASISSWTVSLASSSSRSSSGMEHCPSRLSRR